MSDPAVSSMAGEFSSKQPIIRMERFSRILTGGNYMAESNSDVIKNIYAAFNRGDIESVLAKVQPNAEWMNYGPTSVPYFGNFTGRMAAFFQAIGKA
ncbi:MAG: hypothetical protein ACJ74Y_04815, partial [Bryobacteraceae bacterium]